MQKVPVILLYLFITLNCPILLKYLLIFDRSPLFRTDAYLMNETTFLPSESFLHI